MTNRIDYIKPEIFRTHRIISGVSLKMSSSNDGVGISFNDSQYFASNIVESNRRMLAEQLEVDYSNLIFQKQVHGNTILYVDKAAAEIESDGMIANDEGLILCIKIADCCAVLCYDTTNKAIGAFHSGWKGTKLGIAAKGLKMMEENFGSKADELLIYLSPCAGGDDYEVGSEFQDIFPNSTIVHTNGRFYFDNKKEILRQLLSVGVRESNIEISPFSTISDGRFHSYRRDKDKSGRMAAFIGMAKE